MVVVVALVIKIKEQMEKDKLLLRRVEAECQQAVDNGGVVTDQLLRVKEELQEAERSLQRRLEEKQSVDEALSTERMTLIHLETSIEQARTQLSMLRDEVRARLSFPPRGILGVGH